MNFGTCGPGIKTRWSGDLFLSTFFLKINRDLDDEARDPLEQDNDDGHLGEYSGVFYTSDFGFSEDGEKSSFAEALVLSAADRSALSLKYLSVPRITSVMSLGNCRTEICLVKPW